MPRADGQLRRLEDRVLARELGRLGGIGARWVARLLPTERAELCVELASPSETVLQSTTRALEELGRITQEFDGLTAAGCLSAVVGSGSMNLNPAVVHVAISTAGGHSTNVVISAAAKEGVIKQQSAAGAVEKVRHRLARTTA